MSILIFLLYIQLNVAEKWMDKLFFLMGINRRINTILLLVWIKIRRMPNTSAHLYKKSCVLLLDKK